MTTLKYNNIYAPLSFMNQVDMKTKSNTVGKRILWEKLRITYMCASFIFNNTTVNSITEHLFKS